MKNEYKHIDLQDMDENILTADGFDDALIGYIERAGQPPLALYDRAKCIDVLIRDDEMTHEEAEEHFQYNVVGAYVGEYTPAFATLFDENEDND